MKSNANDKMRVARLAWRLSQRELAEKVGVTRQTICLIEQGRYNPSLSVCLGIAKALGLTLDKLFWDDTL